MLSGSQPEQTDQLLQFGEIVIAGETPIIFAGFLTNFHDLHNDFVLTDWKFSDDDSFL